MKTAVHPLFDTQISAVYAQILGIKERSQKKDKPKNGRGKNGRGR
jgi:hypothetical protein